MATTLTTSYQRISTISVTYGEIRTYAKYNSQSTANNTTTISLKTTYYLRQWIQFSSGTSVLDGTSKSYGNTRLNAGETTLQEFTRTIYHNADGTSPNRNVATSWSAKYGGGGSTSADVVAPRILRQATLTSAPDFNDEANPTIKYTNPAGNSVNTLQACITTASDGTIRVPYRDISKTGTSYTFNLTEAERNTLRSQTPNSNTLQVGFWVKTIIGGTTLFSSAKKTMTIVNGNPTFTHSEVETNTVVSDALGSTSADTIVQNLSNVKVTVVPSAKKSSTIKQVQVTHSGTTYTDTTSPYEFNIKPLANSLDIKVTDSRGNTATQTATKTMLNYAPVKINSFSFKRHNPTSSNIIVNLDATYWNTNIGSVTNAPVVQWKMGSEGTLTTIPSSSVTIDNTNHKITVSNYTLSNQLIYTSGETFYIYVSDAFSSTSNNRFVTKGIPVLDLGDDEVQVNGELYIANTDESSPFAVKQRLQLLECNSNGNVSSGTYFKLCHIKLDYHLQGRFTYFRIFIGDGNNGGDNQNAFIDLTLQQGWTGSENGRFGGTWELHPMKTPFNLSNTNIVVTSDSNLEYDVWFYTTRAYCKPSYTYIVDKSTTITHIGNITQTYLPSGTDTSCKVSGIVVDTPIVLYDNTSGTTGNVTLSETSANFTYLEVFYCHSITKAFSSTKIYAPNGKSVALQVGFQGSSGTNTQFGSAVYSISGTSMTKGEFYGHGQINNGGNGGASKDARVLITRVIGYR